MDTPAESDFGSESGEASNGSDDNQELGRQQERPVGSPSSGEQEESCESEEDKRQHRVWRSSISGCSASAASSLSPSSYSGLSSYERRKLERERLEEGANLVLSNESFTDFIATLTVTVYLSSSPALC